MTLKIENAVLGDVVKDLKKLKSDQEPSDDIRRIVVDEMQRLVDSNCTPPVLTLREIIDLTPNKGTGWLLLSEIDKAAINCAAQIFAQHGQAAANISQWPQVSVYARVKLNKSETLSDVRGPSSRATS